MKGLDFVQCAERLARSSEEADLRSAVSRAYYGAFHEARILLRDSGIRLPKTEQVHVKLMYCLQDCGDTIAENAGQDLEFLRTERTVADYELDDHRFAGRERAQLEIARARRIVRNLEKCRAIVDLREKVRSQARLLGLIVSN